MTHRIRRTRPAASVARHRQRGAALIVGLILLVVLTLLAFAGANTATTELVMAGNEQLRRSASQAAAAGIEQAIARLGEVPTSPAAAPTEREDSAFAGAEVERFRTATRFAGEEHGLPQMSADEFVALHFEIDSSGFLARDGVPVRGATDRQRQGVYVVGAASGQAESSFGRIGTGLP